MSALGAMIGLAIAIILIIKKISPVYSLLLGAVIGGLAGGLNLTETVSTMISGVNDVTPAVVRILAAGVLSGILVKTKAAVSISNTIINRMGRKNVYLALALATMLLTAIGVFIDVAVITVAPIALTVGKKLNISRSALLIMMIGGGKCGNIISPNPNTIISAENFNADLYSVMYANLIPAVIGLLFTVYVIGRLVKKEAEKDSYINDNEELEAEKLPGFFASVSGPVIAILLLSFRPLFDITIDPMIALPAGGLAGIIIMNKCKMLKSGLSYGLEKMSGVSILLIGTGTIAGIIKASTIKDVLIGTLGQLGISDALLAPTSGMLMSAATASTTAGATVASSSFAETILAAGVSGVWGAAMINSGATVFDHFPHGSFFHATGGVAGLEIGKRLRLIPYESAIGGLLAILTTTCYYIFA